MKPTIVRAVVEYQHMGDITGREFVEHVMREADDSLFTGWRILDSGRGAWGLELVLFTVDFHADLFGDEGHAEAKGHVNDIVNEWFNDSLDVRWVYAVVNEPEAEAVEIRTADGRILAEVDADAELRAVGRALGLAREALDDEREGDFTRAVREMSRHVAAMKTLVDRW